MAGDESLESRAFSKEVLCKSAVHSPVIVVGLPRSGSSYFSHVLSCIQDWFVFDDLYLLRKAASINALDDVLDQKKFEELNDFMRWQVKARVIFEENFQSLGLTERQVDEIHDIIGELFSSAEFRWYEIMEEWLIRVANFNGSTMWGYKAPQDFMNIALIREIYPKVKFIHLVRDPRKILASFKFLGGEDGTRLQYHPYFYSKYWLMASKVISDWREQGVPIFTVKFEELVKDPTGVAKGVATFLGAKMDGEVPAMGANSSHSGNSARKGITPLETALCQKIAGGEFHRYGYALETPKIRPLLDTLELIWISLRFFLYQCFRYLTNKDRRQSIILYAKNFVANNFKKTANP